MFTALPAPYRRGTCLEIKLTKSKIVQSTYLSVDRKNNQTHSQSAKVTWPLDLNLFLKFRNYGCVGHTHPFTLPLIGGSCPAAMAAGSPPVRELCTSPTPSRLSAPTPPGTYWNDHHTVVPEARPPGVRHTPRRSSSSSDLRQSATIAAFSRLFAPCASHKTGRRRRRPRRPGTHLYVMDSPGQILARLKCWHIWFRETASCWIEDWRQGSNSLWAARQNAARHRHPCDRIEGHAWTSGRRDRQVPRPRSPDGVRRRTK